VPAKHTCPLHPESGQQYIRSKYTYFPNNKKFFYLFYFFYFVKKADTGP